MFGFQRRFARLCENETFLPNPGVLPQMSQTAAMSPMMLPADCVDAVAQAPVDSFSNAARILEIVMSPAWK